MILLRRGWEGDEENLGQNTIVCQPPADPVSQGQLGYCTGGGGNRGRREKGIILGRKDIHINSTFANSIY